MQFKDFNLEPPTPDPEFELCPICKEYFITYDYVYGENKLMRYARWDHKKEVPICCDECLETYHEENAHDYEEEEDGK